MEFAKVILGEVARPEGAALLLEEAGRDARAFGGGHSEASPFVAAAGPFVVKEAAFAVGRAEEPEAAAADREHGTKGAVEIIGDARGFVDEQQGDGGEAADGGFEAGDADDARAVR